MLTFQQRKLLRYIVEYTALNEGLSPSFDDMKDALSLKSKSGIHRMITALEERGFIRRLPHRARALEVIRRPDAPAPRPTNGSGRCPYCKRPYEASAGQSPASTAPRETVDG